jgi:ribosomal-protein-alanine N-acetyltransferase
MTLLLRYMHNHDISQVVTIDRIAFSAPWSAQSYAHEINESNYSHMVVLTKTHDTPSKPTGWRDWINWPGISSNGKQPSEIVLGYGGLWNIADEAHISTIASHPDYRGRGYGELLLGAMLRRSITLRAEYVVLEVRVSNIAAQNLYRKYGFEVSAVKKDYYRDNHEDAYDMRLELDSDH